MHLSICNLEIEKLKKYQKTDKNVNKDYSCLTA